MKICLSTPALVCILSLAGGCSGDGGKGDGGVSEAGLTVESGAVAEAGSIVQLDGAPGRQDAGPTSVDLARVWDGPGVTPDTAGLLGPDATTLPEDAGRDLATSSRDGSAGLADAAQVTSDVAGPRDGTAQTLADAAAIGKDAAVTSGNVLVDRLAVASVACGSQSRLTVPAGWQMVLAGESGCAFYVPPTWQTIGAGTPNTFAVEDSSRVTGSSVLAGVDTTGTATCTPHGVASWLFSNNKDCVGFQELYWKDGVDNVAGVQIPRGELVYSCTQSGVPIVGYMVVQIHGTWPMCNLLAFAFWMPQTQIESRTCTLTQTLNSIQCPQGGRSCDDAACAESCGGSGYCSDDDCVCK